MKKEVKAAPPSGGDALMRAFESFKEANDERLKALERKHGDVLLEEKVDRIDRALSEQKAAFDRLALNGRRAGLSADPSASEHKSAWSAYMRRGDLGALATFEAKALSVVGDPTPGGADGGYTAPPELDRLIETRLRQVSPMREIATVRTTGANVFKKPISITAAGTGWVSETGSRTQTTTPTLTLMEFPTAELYANLAATQTLLDDSFVNLEEWIAGEVEEAFAGQERAAFVSGDGSNKPKGFLGYTMVAEASHVCRLAISPPAHRPRSMRMRQSIN
ncbi:MAG: phage major capsid protein [Hyphomonadaceae bacterium]|nr:phage major capsid protein [Hyphomonadaceae bacterium]